MKLRRALALTALLAASCSRAAPSEQAMATDSAGARNTPAAAPSRSPSAEPELADTLATRIAAIDAAIARWRGADDLATARAAAEQARNLVVGPAGPYYGDANGDGTIAGASAAGLLPGLDGAPGLAAATPNACVTRDVLGGDWSDPARHWAILRTAIANWKPGNNTFPKLPSHPQRIVGWATLALATDSVATARDYAGHAKLHADISMRAVRECPS